MRFRRRKLSPKINLLDLPNCLILQLLSYLDATSLYLLSRTCERLDDLIKDHTSLWRHVDARRAPNSLDKVAYCLDRGHDDTRTLLVRSDDQTETILPDHFFSRVAALQNLTVMALENQTIDSVRYAITAFPEGLQELSLKRSVVVNPMRFFRFSGDHMRSLRVLILDGCDWVHSSTFMPISKYKSLEILSVYKCKNVDNSIPYLSLSGQYGFKNLKIFDARLSPLGNTLLRSLHKSGSLLAIYLQNEDASYKLDYFRRKLHILKGAPTRDFYTEDKEFELKEMDCSNCIDSSSVDDSGLLDYLSTSSDPSKVIFPHSFLYTDPYNACNCGYEERHNGKLHFKDKKRGPATESSDSDDSDNDDDDRGRKETDIRELEFEVRRLSESVAERTGNGVPVNSIEGERFRVDFGNVIEVHLNPAKRSHGNPEEAEAKRRRTGEEAGPSGLNREEEAEPQGDGREEEEPEDMVPVDFNVVRIEHVDNVAKKNLIPLRRLSLRGFKRITEVVLYFIKDLDLDLLDLTYTNVTVDGINNYLIDHPSCRIVHEKFCVCPTNLHF